MTYGFDINAKWYSWILFILALLGFGVLGTGCQSAGRNTVDSTKLAQAIFAGESNPQFGRLSKELAGTPGDIVFPTVPGKNVVIRAKKNPDGSWEFNYDASRSEVIDMVIAGIKDIDALKYMEVAAERKFLFDIADRVMAVAGPFIDILMQRLTTAQNAPPEPVGPSRTQTILAALKDPAARQELLAFLRDLRAASGAGDIPTTQP